MKTLRKIISTLFIIIFLLVVTAILLAYFYEDKISGLLIDRLNRHLKTEISVENTKLSFIKKFPNATFELKNVYAKPVKEFSKSDFDYNCDTLFQAQKIDLQFNVIQLIKKQYIIRSIHFNDGKINILIDNENVQNYKFWDSKTSKDTGDFRLDLQNIRVVNTVLKYHNLKNKVEFNALSHKTDINGKIASKTTSLKINSDAHINLLFVNNNDILSSKPIKIKTELDVGEDFYTFKSGDITMPNGNFDITGTIENIEDDTYLDLLVNGNKMTIRSFLSLIPEKYVENIKDYSSNGDFYFTATLKGKASSGRFPNFDAKFGIKNGNISKNNTPWNFANVYLQGNYSSSFNRENNFLTLNDISAQIDSSIITGNFTIKNFKNPEFLLQTSSEINLADIKKLFSIDTLEVLNGRTICNLNIEGTIPNTYKIEKKDMLNWHMTGNAKLEQINLKIKGDDYAYKIISGSAKIDKTLQIENLRCVFAGNALNGNGVINNLPSYIVNNSTLSISDINIYSSHFVTDSLSSPAGKTEKSWPIPFPEKIKYAGNFRFKKFSSDKFIAYDVIASVSYKPQMLVVHSVEMNTMKGHIFGGGAMVLNKAGELNTITTLELEDIDITDLFASFNDFGQKEITYENLIGKLTGTVSFAGDWDANQKIIKSSIQSECKILIKNGELVQFKPMLNLSKYCEVSELMNIRFSNLENEIIIKDEKVIIPLMDIHSNAFNISASGVHQFDNHYEYKIRVLLSEVLFKKAKKAKKENQEFAVMEEDDMNRASLYFTITGDNEDYKVSYDKKSAIENIKHNLQEERKEFKALLREEFGWFKKDTTIQNNDTDKDQKPVFIIEWENRDTTSQEDKSIEDKPFQIQWEDE